MSIQDKLADELLVIKDVTQKLESAAFDYMLTGSLAMSYYAVPRMTRDVDIVLGISKGSEIEILKLFENDYYISDSAVFEAVKNSSMFNIIHNDTLVKVDCIIRKPSEYRINEFIRRKRAKIDNFEVWIVSKEDLILSKLIWAKNADGSAMQMNDVKQLIESGYDSQYLDFWAKNLGIEEMLEESK